MDGINGSFVSDTAYGDGGASGVAAFTGVSAGVVGGAQQPIPVQATGNGVTESGAPAISPPEATFNSSSYEWLVALASMSSIDGLNQTALAVGQALKNQNQKIQKVTAQRVEKLQEAIKKLGEIAKAEKAQGIWGMIGKVFSYIGAALAMLGGIVLCVANPALGAVVIGVAVLALAGMISKDAGGPDVSVGGMIGMVVEACGVDKNYADLVAMVSNVVVNLALAVVSYNAVSAATDVSSAVSTMTKVSNIAQGISGVGSGTCGVGRGVNGVEAAKLYNEADVMNADAALIQAYSTELTKIGARWLEDLKVFMEVSDASLKETISRLTDTHSSYQQNQIA